MDPVSIASGIAGLISLSVTLIGFSYKYISGAYKASEKESQYIFELTNLKLLFLRLQEIIDTPEGRASKLLATLPISECKRDLEQLCSKLKKRGSSRLFAIRFNKLSWPFVEEETAQLVEMLHRYREIFQTALTAEGFAFTTTILREVTLLKTDMQFEAVLSWLCSANFEEKQRDVFRQHHPRSGRWFLDSPPFTKWLTTKSPRIWCHGDPGAGKTVMTSMVINHISEKINGESASLAYFYCDYQDQDKQTPDYFVASLLKQLVRRMLVLPSKLEELYQMFCKERRLPKLSDLTNLLLQISGSFSQTYLVIDALDESDSRRHRRQLLSVLYELGKCQDTIKIFVTSRSHPADIRSAFENGPNIKITASKSDIRDYITSRLDNDENLADLIQPKLRNEIVDHITEVAGGMFLLARLQMDSVCAATTIREIRHALKTMPSDLRRTFDVALERVQDQSKQHAALALRVLAWLTHARRPFSVEELCHGLAVEPDTSSLDDENLPAPKLLVNVCGGLVSIDRESSTIRLAHLTVQEYFKEMSPRLFGEIEVLIAESCVTYLLFDAFSAGVCQDDESLEIRLQEYPFLRYSAKHWGDHVEFLLQIAFQGCYNAYYKDLTALHMAANWNLPIVLEHLLEGPDIRDIGTKDFDGKTPLHHPCRLSNEAVMSLLIEHGADISAFDDYGRPPLRFAVDGGKPAAVKLLLDKGAGVNAPVDYHGGTALHWAARMGYAPIVQLLLEYGADTAVRCYDGRTALDYAKHNRHDETAALLSRFAPIADDGYEQRTALHKCSREGDAEATKRLLDQGCNANALAEGDTTPLHLAVLGGHEKVVELLLNNGANASAVAKDGRTILHRAVEGGNETVVRLVLACNPDLETRDAYGRVPLHWAARMGNEALVRLLLDHGADAAATDSHGRTPMQQAVFGGQEKIVELLASISINP
ncbi:Ankyrin-3 [Drechslerella dactyloides]|uniref:Ankyrin-3 n=1 Tax=Drechslerella dactyloides TaxID=74499 RepID=A0AAD6IR69_DREDA|nr:Ankyrin-3 [Drechslerella dactyloides]